MSHEPAKIMEMDACDLIGRLVTNTHGAMFLVERLTFDAIDASVTIWIRGMEENGDLDPHDYSGLKALKGWTVHHKHGQVPK